MLPLDIIKIIKSSNDSNNKSDVNINENTPIILNIVYKILLKNEEGKDEEEDEEEPSGGKP